MLTDLKISLGEALKKAGKGSVVIEQHGNPSHAIIPLDDDGIDFLLEHNPRFIKECQNIFKRMKSGKTHSLEDVARELGIPLNGNGAVQEVVKRSSRHGKRLASRKKTA